MCVYMCVCVCVCLYVCMSVCVCVFVRVHVGVCYLLSMVMYEIASLSIIEQVIGWDSSMVCGQCIVLGGNYHRYLFGGTYCRK